MRNIGRREFLGAATVAGAALFVGPNALYAADVPLEEATIASLQAAMAAGRTTAKKITQGYLARIAKIDPQLRSIIELNPDALTIAVQLDNERKAGKIR